jgi:hypothetical protein
VSIEEDNVNKKYQELIEKRVIIKDSSGEDEFIVVEIDFDKGITLKPLIDSKRLCDFCFNKSRFDSNAFDGTYEARFNYYIEKIKEGVIDEELFPIDFGYKKGITKSMVHQSSSCAFSG